jgi:hypothetical protein
MAFKCHKKNKMSYRKSLGTNEKMNKDWMLRYRHVYRSGKEGRSSKEELKEMDKKWRKYIKVRKMIPYFGTIYLSITD